VDEDVDRAVRLYKLAGRGGIPQGYARLSMLYESGDSIASDPAKAIFYLRQAADLGALPTPTVGHPLLYMIPCRCHWAHKNTTQSITLVG
jgi:TPR repeat protein